MLKNLDKLKNSNISEEQIYSTINNMSQKDIEKINEKKDDIEKIYKHFSDSNKS